MCYFKKSNEETRPLELNLKKKINVIKKKKKKMGPSLKKTKYRGKKMN